MGMIEGIFEVALGMKLAKAFDTSEQDTQDREDARTRAICETIERQQRRQEFRENFSQILDAAMEKMGDIDISQLKAELMQGAAQAPALIADIKASLPKMIEMKAAMQDIATPSDLWRLDKLIANLKEILRLAGVEMDYTPSNLTSDLTQSRQRPILIPIGAMWPILIPIGAILIGLCLMAHGSTTTSAVIEPLTSYNETRFCRAAISSDNTEWQNHIFSKEAERRGLTFRACDELNRR